MPEAIALMLLTGLLWAAVGVLFGAAPSERDRLDVFFSLNGLLFTAFVWLSQAPESAPAREVLRLAALIVPSACTEVAAFFFLKNFCQFFFFVVFFADGDFQNALKTVDKFGIGH